VSFHDKRLGKKTANRQSDTSLFWLSVGSPYVGGEAIFVGVGAGAVWFLQKCESHKSVNFIPQNITSRMLLTCSVLSHPSLRRRKSERKRRMMRRFE